MRRQLMLLTATAWPWPPTHCTYSESLDGASVSSRCRQQRLHLRLSSSSAGEMSSVTVPKGHPHLVL